jgi:hypothetical protein
MDRACVNVFRGHDDGLGFLPLDALFCAVIPSLKKCRESIEARRSRWSDRSLVREDGYMFWGKISLIHTGKTGCFEFTVGDIALSFHPQRHYLSFGWRVVRIQAIAWRFLVAGSAMRSR